MVSKQLKKRVDLKRKGQNEMLNNSEILTLGSLKAVSKQLKNRVDLKRKGQNDMLKNAEILTLLVPPKMS